MICNHIPVPVFEERRGNQALVLAGFVCGLCTEPLSTFVCYPGQREFSEFIVGVDQPMNFDKVSTE